VPVRQNMYVLQKLAKKFWRFLKKKYRYFENCNERRPFIHRLTSLSRLVRNKMNQNFSKTWMTCDCFGQSLILTCWI
jgi:hypothetical protein